MAAELLDGEAETAFLCAHVDDLGLDFLAFLEGVGRGLDLLAEAELGNVHQAFNTFLNLDEEAELGDVGDDALHGAAHGIGGRHMAPGIFNELLDAESELLVLLVNGEDLGLHHVAHMIELAGMAFLVQEMSET